MPDPIRGGSTGAGLVPEMCQKDHPFGYAMRRALVAAAFLERPTCVTFRASGAS